MNPLDALLHQIIAGFFVLTDGQGAVSKWSDPAELLFGRTAEQILGQRFFESLIGAGVPVAGQAWRSFLADGTPPIAPGCVELTGRHADGQAFPLETVFVPVRLDEGFDFSLFLEDLGFELPLNLMLHRVHQQHAVVVRALRRALAAQPQPWEGWRTAGTLIVFRPLGATPWVDAELAAREAARAEADAEAEERLTNPDPGIQGDSLADLEDAATVVARLRTAMERIDELERLVRALPAQLDDARREAAAAEAARAQLEARVDALEAASAGSATAAGARPASGIEQRAAAAFAEAGARVGAPHVAFETRLAEVERAHGGDGAARAARLSDGAARPAGLRF